MEKETKKGGKFAEFIKTHKVLSIVLACVIVAVIASAIVCFAIFGKDIVNAITSAGDNSDKEAATYTVTIKSQGGMALTGIDVYVYDNDRRKIL